MNCGTPIAPANEPFGIERREALIAREQHVLLQLAAKEGGSPRIVERERCQRVDHAVAADVAAVVGFHADDRDDDLGAARRRLALRARQRLVVVAPELHAAVDPLLREERRRVLEPLRRLEQRPVHERDDLRLELRGGEPALDIARGRPVSARNLGGVRAHVGALRIAGRCRRRRLLRLGVSWPAPPHARRSAAASTQEQERYRSEARRRRMAKERRMLSSRRRAHARPAPLRAADVQALSVRPPVPVRARRRDRARHRASRASIARRATASRKRSRRGCRLRRSP